MFSCSVIFAAPYAQVYFSLKGLLSSFLIGNSEKLERDKEVSNTVMVQKSSPDIKDVTAE